MKHPSPSILAGALFAAAAAGALLLYCPPPDRPPEREKPGRSDALSALDDWTRARAYPDPDVPSGKLYAGYVAARAHLKESGRSPSAASIWVPVGPLNGDSRGRSISVAVNPVNTNVVYCGTASGGLWRTERSSLGGDWKRVTLGYPALGIGAIAIDPVDTNIMYVGTGEVYRYGGALGGLMVRTTRGSYGVGILKTSDGGKTWGASLDWTYNQQRGVQMVRINPANHNTLYAATTEGIYKSVDQGGSWSSVLNAVMATDLVINGSDTTMLLAACGNFASPGHGIYRSTDAGETWTFIPGGQSTYSGLARLETYGANPFTVYASVADSTSGAGGLWRSADFGGSWTRISTASIFGVQGWYSHFVAVHPTDSTQIVHAGLSPYKSSDGGAVFAASNGGYSDNHSYAHDPRHPDVLYIVSDNGIYRSSDFGANFVDVGNGMQTLQFYNGFSNSATDSSIAVGQVQDHIPGYRYVGTPEWDRPDGTDEVGWTAIDPTNDNIMYATEREGIDVRKSTTRGSTFYASGSLGGTGAWNTPIVIAPSAPAVLYVGKNYIFKSTDAGSSWATANNGTTLDGNPMLSMAVSAKNQNVVFAGSVPFATRAHIFRTTNGGASWVNVTGTLPDRYPMDLALNPLNDNTVYAAFGGFGTGHLFKSTDRGSSWNDISGSLPDAPTPAVLVDPLDTSTVYCGDDAGMYISTDGGTTWGGFGEGLPEAVICADLSMNVSGRVLRLATHGNGVWERRLAGGGQTWLFDYQALTLDAPPDGARLLLDAVIPEFDASVQNVGAAAPADSFDVIYRVMKGGTVLFSSQKRIAALASGEVRRVRFDGTFAPPDTGEYLIQFITLAGDQNPANDTLDGIVNVIVPGQIAYSSVTKIASPYEELPAGSPGPSGDDAQKDVLLPFPFSFDGYTYDSLQISTNGWVEFGTGTQGSERGLSTPAQIGPAGAGGNGRLGTIQRPTKALGPWWEDLNADLAGSSVTYATLGSAPGRTFVVQWKNMRAYYDPSVTTAVNFQVRLYETGSVVDFCYGAVTPGTFGGSDAGAMIGMKDDPGGDYHYYDIAKGGTGSAAEVVTDLSPLTGWPGRDSCYRIQGIQTTRRIAHDAGWNLISAPLAMSDYSLCRWLQCGGGNPAYRYTSVSYIRTDSLTPGTGCWFKFPYAGGMFFAGSPLPALTVHLNEGWNLFGTVDHDVPAPAGGPLSSIVYRYTGADGYAEATTLSPGGAYWVKADTAVDIVLGPAAAPNTSRIDPAASDRFTFADNRGSSQTLYIARDRRGRVNEASFDMPPPGPGGFDARFGSRRMIEVVRDNEPHEFPVRISSARYPLTVRWNLGASQSALLMVGGTGVRMEGSGSAPVPDGTESMTLRVSGPAGLPARFALFQNYPNPFNPSTVIRYALPAGGDVTLKVYTILGEEVATLVDEAQEAGYKTVRFDARSAAGAPLPSGVYFCRIRAGSFASVIKMVLLR